MKYNFYTLFDKGFLAKGIVLYESVARNCPGPFRFWIVCLDNESYDLLKKLDLKSVILLHLKDIEDDDLRKAKQTRSLWEYCWTVKPSIATYIFTHYPDIETLMYLDGDLYFYSSLEPIYKELGNNSVLLFPHYLPEGKKEKEEEVGKYNAGMLLFRNDKNGRECLEWWRKECNAWCYAKPEPGKLGDQKYLDFFAERFKGVCVSKHKGIDVAPWNLKNHRGIIKKTKGKVFIGNEPLVNFHFSSLSLYYPFSSYLPNGPENSYGYTRQSLEKKLIYDEYIEKIYGAMERIRILKPGFTNGMLPRPNTQKQIQEMITAIGINTTKKALRPLVHYIRNKKKKTQQPMKQQNNKKRILVTGGLGFIGSNFIQLAFDKGYYVINIDKKTYAARTDLDFDSNPNYEFIEKDVCDLKTLPKDIHYIVNFAAESHVDNSLVASMDFFRSNIQGTYTILELLRKENPATRPILIQISTDEVYGDRKEGSSIELNTLRPSSPYSSTKAAADQLVFGWGRSYGITYRICRSSNNYGYGQYPEKLIPRTIKLAYKNIKMEVHGDGSYQREWIQVDDNCEGIFLVMEKGENNEIYNISTGETWSNLEVVKMILKEMGKPEDFFVFVKNRIGQDVRYSVDPSKIKALGWKPKHTLQEYLPKYLELCEIGRQQSKVKKPLLKRVLYKITK